MSVIIALIQLFSLLNYIFAEKKQKLNYTIDIYKIVENKCERELNKLYFILECSIYPAPYCDTHFNLSLLMPENKFADCSLIDDIDNKINCVIEGIKIPINIIFKRQFIQLNGYRINIDIYDSPIESKETVFCNHIFFKRFFNNIILYIIILFLI